MRGVAELRPYQQRIGPKGRRGYWHRPFTHGMSETPIYRQWAAMVQRGSNPNLSYAACYVGRGITVCAEWRDFATFYRDMGAEWRPGLTLDRIDNSRGYGPGNCRWATRKEQAFNNRRVHLIDTPWGRIPLGEASERSGISRTTLYSRLKAGTELFR